MLGIMLAQFIDKALMHARIVTKRMADVRSQKSLEIVSQGSFVFIHM